MKGNRSFLLEFEGRFIDEMPFNGGTLKIEPMFRPQETLQTIATVVGMPVHNDPMHPHNLAEGDKVRVWYNAIDGDQPIMNRGAGDSGIYRIDPMHILHRIEPVIEMQCGWIAVQSLPVPIPDGFMAQKINNQFMLVGKATGVVSGPVDFSGIKNRGKVKYVGTHVEGLDAINSGETVIMAEGCEFPNNGHNEILGEKFWFVHQKDIIGKIL